MTKINMAELRRGMRFMTSRNTLIAKKYAPAVMTGVGVVGVVGSAVLACRETLKAEAVVDEARKMLSTVHEAREVANDKDYTPTDYKKDLTVVYMRAASSFIKLYAPSLVLGAISISLIIGGQHIMWQRNAAIAAAYTGLKDAYDRYRGQVVEEYGDGADKAVYAKAVDPVKTEESDDRVDSNGVSPYARFFDEYNPHWTKNADMNLTFLRMQEAYFNDKLKANGHLFLNEVYDALAIPRSKAGAITGWIWGGDGDDYVDFGIYRDDSPARRDFVNGYERSILLDFNVDGVIYDLI